MIIAVEDKSYRCKDCDSFGQCEYYNNRRPTSHICKEFTNDSKVAEVLADIKAEIKGWYWQADKQALAKDPCVVDSMIDLFIRTIDKHIRGDKADDKNSV